MNPEMLRMLAERAGVPWEQVEALQAGDPSALLGAAQSNPMLSAMLLSRMQQSREPASEDEDPARHLALARRKIRALQEDLAAADALGAYVAGVFGACPACWGLSPECARCSGRGRPGRAAPDREMLLAWVRPALRRLGLKVVKETEPVAGD